MQDSPRCIGPYDVVIQLASGGMATTYLAHKRGNFFFERLVVVKRIHPWLVEQPNSHAMLREEARLAAAIHHPNVVHVEDVMNEGNEVCLVMPYVESLSLAALLAEMRNAGERLAPAIASRILIDILMGLDAAHEAKDLHGLPLEIVHRDVSPNNVLVGADGRSRVIDFGIARAARRLCHTQSGDIKGTIAYMSPEQLRRRELDRRADVFAAGAVLFEALTGKRLFDGRDEADILLGVLADEIPQLHERLPDVSADVDMVLGRALARDRDERFDTARAFAEALEAAIAPANASDVALLVERLAHAELSRRRKAIREFVDERSSADLQSPVSNDPAQFVVAKPRRMRWRAIALVSLGIVLIAATSLVIGANASDTIAFKNVDDVRVVKHIDDRSLPELSPNPSANSPQQAPINAKAQVTVPLRAAVPNVAASVGRKVTIREKVDKRQPSELQENPYR